MYFYTKYIYIIYFCTVRVLVICVIYLTWILFCCSLSYLVTVCVFILCDSEINGVYALLSVFIILIGYFEYYPVISPVYPK
jgi:hypothetical protein